jgi:hypothetical protein
MTPTTDLQKLLDEATKGPWDVTKSAWDERHYVEGENTVCYMYALREDDHVILHCDNYESNALLIAMAPDLAARVLELEAENKRLREGLKPFADVANGFDFDLTNDQSSVYLSFYNGLGGHEITAVLNVADLERAGAALKEEAK